MLDPKPHLSRAAILANIDYYKSLEIKYSNEYRLAQEQHMHWLRELTTLANQERLNLS